MVTSCVQALSQQGCHQRRSAHLLLSQHCNVHQSQVALPNLPEQVPLRLPTGGGGGLADEPGPRAHETPFPCWDLSLRDMMALCPHFQSQEERSVISPCLRSCHTDGKASEVAAEGRRCWAQHFLLYYAGAPLWSAGTSNFLY